MSDTTVTTVPVPPPSGAEAREPARLTGYVTGIVQGIAAFLTSYGLTYDSKLPHLLTVLIIALITFFATVIPIAQSETIRGKVYSAASVAKILEAAVQAAPPVIAAGEAVVKDIAPPASPAPAAPDGAPATAPTA